MPTSCTEVLWVPLHISRRSHHNCPCSRCAWQREYFPAHSGLQISYLWYQNVRQLIFINFIWLARKAHPYVFPGVPRIHRIASLPM